MQEIENLIINKLNKIFPNYKTFRYKKNITGKYLTIKCVKCKKFSFWLKNKDNKNMAELCNKNNEAIEIKEEFKNSLNLIPFRKINLLHNYQDHINDLKLKIN